MRKNIFDEPVYARYVRIWPTMKESQMACMRIELYGHVPLAEIGKSRKVTIPRPPAGNGVKMKQLITNIKIVNYCFSQFV